MNKMNVEITIYKNSKDFVKHEVQGVNTETLIHILNTIDKMLDTLHKWHSGYYEIRKIEIISPDYTNDFKSVLYNERDQINGYWVIYHKYTMYYINIKDYILT